MSETDLQRQIQIAASRRGYRLLRNQVGLAWFGVPCYDCSQRLRRVRTGLGVGSSDLIGWKVGTGRFTGFEVKTATGRATEEQLAFIAQVLKDGGDARIVRSVDEI